MFEKLIVSSFQFVISVPKKMSKKLLLDKEIGDGGNLR